MTPVNAATPARGLRAVGDPRAAGRFPVNAGAACSFASPVVEDFGPVRLLNVSMAGVGLRLSGRVEPGTVLAVGLSNPAKGFAKLVLVRVAQVTNEPSGSVVGGTFVTPLTYQEMSALVT
jgi:hypothetical protein